MKKIALILMIVLPGLCFGQSQLKVTDKMKTVPVVTIINQNFISPNELTKPLAGSMICLDSQFTKDEYEAIVFDAGYESFLLTQKSKDFYSESYLKTKNRFGVTEWNIRHNNPSLYDSSIYEVNINYDPKIDYRLEVEYRLYMFFRFMEKQHGVSILNDLRAGL